MHLFRSRPFALLFAGEAINGIGSWAALIALWGFAAYRFGSGPTEIALLALCWSAPAALLGPAIGVPIDRLGPRRVLLVSYAASAAAAAAMAFAGSLTQLAGLTIVYGVCTAVSTPAADSLPPRIVDDADLVAANALLGSAQESAIVFGPLVAAAAIAVAGLRAAFLVDAATYLVGVAVIFPLELRPLEPRPHVGLRVELGEGLTMAARIPVVRYVMVLSTSVFLSWAAFVVLEPLYARDVLHRPASQFALFQVAFGCGLVLTGLALPRLATRLAIIQPMAVALAVLTSGFAAALYIGTKNVTLAYVGVFLWGVDVGFFVTPARTLLQRAVPPHAHGRVFALWHTANSLSDVVALSGTGFLIAAVGVRAAGLGMAAALGLTGIAGLLLQPKAPTVAGEVLATAA